MFRPRRILLAICALALLSPSTAPARQDAAAHRIDYAFEPREGRSGVQSRFTAPQVALLEKLNRADRARLDRLPLLVVPKVWLEDELAYSPFPRAYAAAAAHPKMIVVDLPGQAFGAYARGELVRWGPVNSGTRATPTPPGSYALTWRSTGHASSVNPDWYMRWYFNFDSREGLAFHEYALPGGTASHGCIRLLERDAMWLYNWGEGWTRDAVSGRIVAPGTPVLVIGPYRYDAPPPWRSPEWLRQPITLP